MGAGAHRRGARGARGNLLRGPGGRGLSPRIGGDDGARAGPIRDRAHRPGPHPVHRFRGHRRRDPGTLRGGHRAVGSVRQGDGAAGLPVAGRTVPGPNPHLQHLRGLPLRSKPSRLGDGRLGAGRRRGGSVRRPRRLPPPGRRAGAQSAGARYLGDEDMAVRPRGGGVRRLLHLRPRSRSGARAVPQDSRCGGRPDGHHGGAAFTVAPPRRGQDRGRSRALRSLLVRGSGPHGQPRGPDRLRRKDPCSDLRERDPRRQVGVPRAAGDGGVRNRDARRLVVRRSDRGSQDRGAGGYLPSAGGAARLLGAGHVHGLRAPVPQRAERPRAGVGAFVLHRLVP